MSDITDADAERIRRLKAIKDLQGKFKHLNISTDDVLRMKAEERELEDRKEA